MLLHVCCIFGIEFPGVFGFPEFTLHPIDCPFIVGDPACPLDYDLVSCLILCPRILCGSLVCHVLCVSGLSIFPESFVIKIASLSFKSLGLGFIFTSAQFLG